MFGDERMGSDSKGRHDGRSNEKLRGITIKAGVQGSADGSAYIEWGKNKVMASAYGPRAPMTDEKYHDAKAKVNCTYTMAPFSVSERKRARRDRRSTEISKVLSEALQCSVRAERFPRSVIDVEVLVLDADAGTRCACLTAASVALADAGIPLYGLVSACSVGKAKGELIVDPDLEEDQKGEADMPVGVLSPSGEIVLFQMDGLMVKGEIEEALKMAYKACEEVLSLQRDSLVSRFGGQGLSVRRPAHRRYGEYRSYRMGSARVEPWKEDDTPVWDEDPEGVD